TLADAEAFLVAAGFDRVRGTCDWRNADGDDAGCSYAIEDWHYDNYGALKGFRVEINRVNRSAVGPCSWNAVCRRAGSVDQEGDDGGAEQAGEDEVGIVRKD